MRDALIAGFAAVLCASAVGAIASPEKTESPDPLVQAMASEQASVRYAARTHILADRDRTIKALVQIVEDPSLREPNPDAVLEAIRLLGRIRAAEAADSLLEVIDFTPPGYYGEASSDGASLAKRLGYYGRRWASPSPAGEALVEIGSPTLPAILRYIVRDRLGAWLRQQPERSPSEWASAYEKETARERLRRGYCAVVIRDIEGKRRGMILLEDALAKAGTAPEREALEKVMDLLKSLPPRSDEPVRDEE